MYRCGRVDGDSEERERKRGVGGRGSGEEKMEKGGELERWQGVHGGEGRRRVRGGFSKQNVY